MRALRHLHSFDDEILDRAGNRQKVSQSAGDFQGQFGRDGAALAISRNLDDSIQTIGEQAIRIPGHVLLTSLRKARPAT